jgi:hypothetical protein
MGTGKSTTQKPTVPNSVVDPEQFGKLDPNPHQTEKLEALEGHF